MKGPPMAVEEVARDLLAFSHAVMRVAVLRVVGVVRQRTKAL